MKLVEKFCLLIIAVALCAVSVLAEDRALLVGIENYRDTAKCNSFYNNYPDGCVPPTFGGIDDAVSIKTFLERYYKFPAKSIRLLNGKDATAARIRQEIKNWLITGTKPGDRVFFLFSGHGTQLDDQTGGDEEDKRDEAIVPFDVLMDDNYGEFIRDDEFNAWLKELKGRRVAMLFDSCHSGTISRGFSRSTGKPPRYLPVIKTDVEKPQTRGFSDKDDYSFVPSNVKSRDLLVTKESIEDDGFGSAVFITAALPYQQAFPIEVSGKYRGALAYLFEEIHSRNGENLPSISEIRDFLKEAMRDLGRQKILEQQKPHIQDIYDEKFQVPTVEIFSKCENGGATLFTVGSASVCGAQNPQSNIQISFKMKDRKPVYYEDELFEFDISISEEAYLYVIVFMEEDEAMCVFPNQYDKSNRLTRGSFPRKTGEEEYEFSAGKPFGRDVWVALATRKPLSVYAGQKGSWKEMFDAIGLPELKSKVLKGANQTRGVTVKPAEPLKKDEWQAVTLVLETRKKAR